MQRVLAETPPERAPWILYMQPDTIIDDIAFTFPFEMYAGKDWVSVGSEESVLKGWPSGARALAPSGTVHGGRGQRCAAFRNLTCMHRVVGSSARRHLAGSMQRVVRTAPSEESAGAAVACECA